MAVTRSRSNELENVVSFFLNHQIHQVEGLEAGELRRRIEKTVAHTLERELDIKLERIDELHNLDDDTKEVIRYMGLKTLVSLLQKNKEGGSAFIRMNDSFHLNDPKEGEFALDNINQKDISKMLRERKPHAYIASFIVPEEDGAEPRRDEDNLKYWLAYGRQGGGCSIRFSVEDEAFRSNFRRVIYGQSGAKSTARKLELNSIWRRLNPLIKNPDEKVSGAAKTILTERIRGAIAKIMYLYKDEAYSYERECRVVKSIPEIISSGEEIQFDECESSNRLSGPRHYVNDGNLNIKKILVTGSKITIGPLVRNPDSVAFYIEELLKGAKLPGPRVEISKIPYQEPSRQNQ